MQTNIDQQGILSGELSLTSVVDFRRLGEQFIKQQAQVQFDFSQVDCVDSAGITLMLAWLRHAEKYNKKIRFLAVPEGLQQLASLYGVADILKECQDNG